MACRDNCEVSDLVVTFASSVGVFPLTAFANEGAAIDFSEDETEVDEKIDSEGDFYLSGMKWVKRDFTVTVHCTAEAIALDSAWKLAGPLKMCGSGVIITNCCSGATSYKSLRLKSVEAPSFGTEVDTYTFRFLWGATRMMEVDKLYEELNIQEDPINIKFSVDEYQFWVSRRGLLRKKVAASRFLFSYYTDEFGVMEGKYDATIDHLLNGVNYVGSDDKAIDLSSGHFWDWVGTLPAEDDNDKLVQSIMIETLPQAVAAVIVGKPELQKMIQRIMTLAERTEPLENQSSIKSKKSDESPKNLKEPVRTSPKVASPSG